MESSKPDCFHLGVKALIVDPTGKVLLLERDHPVKKKYWDIPGGRLQKGESLMETLLREVKEETGLDSLNEISPFMMVLTNIRIPCGVDDSVGLIFSIFLCHLQTSFQPILSSEHINFEWFSPLEPVQNL
jgi:8-oxo-dGTP pyrophosphatase MutT (NUDIX family)